MAAPRLPFLWPMLFKPLTGQRTSASRLIKRGPPSTRTPRRSCRQFATTAHQQEAPPTQRYGKAHEPAPHLRDSETAKPTADKGTEPPIEKPAAAEPPLEDVEEDDSPPPTTTPSTPSKPSALDESAPPVRPPDPPKTGEAKPLDSVLHMPSPQDEESHKPPHLKTPPYVHHFDTYGLVRELSKSTYTPDQSVTLMKAVRGMLMSNMELAREGLVSKSNVENETYLFRAACSELKTEVGNTRKGEIERMRTERAQLQHEVDILGQRLGQETGTLKDELKGLFDDRKMAVRQEQRSMETKIQELNYKITVALNSDARSEVEGLRWVLTRRAAITVGVSAFMLFVALRYTSYVQHQQMEERRKKPPKRDPPLEEQSQGTQTTFDSAAGRSEALGGELLAGEGVSLG
ncbi:hypothetical protein FB567DRAFT_492969 [Paraphoma chrysanthemicola]|uniref:MOZ protein represents a chromatin-associated acetyltransferase n=1 Tax=Paraphoma chrysanthemicola TaxID=798071 RepID=A0A8K0W1L4_9PLEO|nr:hypothetical protein FB567DRAFT_492969 [Paraphoma chrysanthemicola]